MTSTSPEKTLPEQIREWTDIIKRAEAGELQIVEKTETYITIKHIKPQS